MSYAVLSNVILSLLPCLIPPYAFRLNRVFGTQRVGWVLFAVFSLLAALQLVRAWHPFGLGLSPRLTLDLLFFLIPLLLLIGMLHIETLFKERLRVEKEEKRMRAELELQVAQRTAALDTANEELQREISLRKQGGEELRKSKEQYRLLFEENPQPMWIFDLSTFRFLAFNTAALRQYGFSSAEFRDITAQDLCAPEAIEAFVADAAKSSSAIRSGGLWRHRKKDGAIIEVEISAVDLMYGGQSARLVLAYDVTAQRLLEKQLLQSQKTEVTNQLAGGVADNFSKLMALIESEANMLVQESPDAGCADRLKRVAATAGSAAGLTRQLLALVRRHPMRLQPVDLNMVLESQTGQIARVLGKKIVLDKVPWANLPPIMADPNLIAQILHNLVLNARDAMPDGGSLTLSTNLVRVNETQVCSNSEARTGAFVSLSVADTGFGMTPEVQSRLFEPFFTTKTAPKASGLGLATVHGLVKQHSGWIEINSQPGVGSQFNVLFPCAPASATVRR